MKKIPQAARDWADYGWSPSQGKRIFWRRFLIFLSHFRFSLYFWTIPSSSVVPTNFGFFLNLPIFFRNSLMGSLAMSSVPTCTAMHTFMHTLCHQILFSFFFDMHIISFARLIRVRIFQLFVTDNSWHTRYDLTHIGSETVVSRRKKSNCNGLLNWENSNNWNNDFKIGCGFHFNFIHYLCVQFWKFQKRSNTDRGERTHAWEKILN